MVSMTPIFTPCFFNSSENSLAAPSPKALLVERKSAFWMPIDLTIGPKARASISEVVLMRKLHGLPAVVILPVEVASTSTGTSDSVALGMGARDRAGLQVPIIVG